MEDGNTSAYRTRLRDRVSGTLGNPTSRRDEYFRPARSAAVPLAAAKSRER